MSTKQKRYQQIWDEEFALQAIINSDLRGTTNCLKKYKNFAVYQRLRWTYWPAEDFCPNQEQFNSFQQRKVCPKDAAIISMEI